MEDIILCRNCYTVLTSASSEFIASGIYRTIRWRVSVSVKRYMKETIYTNHCIKVIFMINDDGELVISLLD